MLDERQYQALKRLAHAQNKSMGQLVREFVQRGLEETSSNPGSRDAIRRFAGFIDEAEGTGRDHDRILYGKGR